MRKRTIRTFLPLLAATVIGAAQAAEDPSGAALAESCATCHGPTGVSEVPTIPTIAGYDQAYFVDDMLAYKAGDINSPLMETLAQRYSRDELQAMAGFYARHRYEPAPQEFDVERARRGETLHVEYCGICHMDGGSIEAAREWSMPPLAGQWKEYLRLAIDAFSTGRRPMPDGKPPRVEAFLGEHGAEGVEDVLHYYASQQ